MKILFISNLFPDLTEPYRGLDNSVVLHHLAQSCEVRVVSPRPTLPFRSRPRAPRSEDRPFHPVFPPARYIPKIGSLVNHRLFEKSIEPIVHSLRRDFPFDVILCSWAYPDVCGVAILASHLQVPFIAIVQGTDVHSYLSMPIRRRLIASALNRAGAVITRSRDLALRLEAAGVTRTQLHTILNGVDQSIFRPGDRAAARRDLDLPSDASIALFVGNFYPVKDPFLALSAHAAWSKSAPAGASRLLVLVGGGPMEAAIRKATRTSGAGQRNFRGTAKFNPGRPLHAGRRLPAPDQPQRGPSQCHPRSHLLRSTSRRDQRRRHRRGPLPVRPWPPRRHPRSRRNRRSHGGNDRQLQERRRSSRNPSLSMAGSSRKISGTDPMRGPAHHAVAVAIWVRKPYTKKGFR